MSSIFALFDYHIALKSTLSSQHANPPCSLIFQSFFISSSLCRLGRVFFRDAAYFLSTEAHASWAWYDTVKLSKNDQDILTLNDYLLPSGLP